MHENALQEVLLNTTTQNLVENNFKSVNNVRILNISFWGYTYAHTQISLDIKFIKYQAFITHVSQGDKENQLKKCLP